jgi:hypothetical protein
MKMHTLKLKHFTHEFHYPDFHEMAAMVRHAMSSEYFWAVFALVVLVGILVSLAILASTGEAVVPDIPVRQPYYPYFP